MFSHTFPTNIKVALINYCNPIQLLFNEARLACHSEGAGTDAQRWSATEESANEIGNTWSVELVQRVKLRGFRMFVAVRHW